MDWLLKRYYLVKLIYHKYTQDYIYTSKKNIHTSKRIQKPSYLFRTQRWKMRLIVVQRNIKQIRWHQAFNPLNEKDFNCMMFRWQSYLRSKISVKSLFYDLYRKQKYNAKQLGVIWCQGENKNILYNYQNQTFSSDIAP